MTNNRVFPEIGMSWDKVQKQLEQFMSLDLDIKKERLLTGIHKGSDEVHNVCKSAYNMYFHGNGFIAGFDATSGMAQMQNEVLRMVVEILNGGSDGRANITSGGTESIFCAMHTAREWAKVNRLDIKQPYEVIMPWTGHPAFDKSAHYLGMTVKRVQCGNDYRADVKAMEEAISPNTMFIVGSSPCWGLGLMDPIPEIGVIAEKYGLWMHSDCCVGGFLLPWLERLGAYNIPQYDFRVPGVSSISADLHKHGYAAKPCSTVLYRSEELQQYHWVSIDDWQSGHYSMQGFVGSRPASAVSAAWAVMKYLGEKGYLDLTRRSLEIKDRLIKGIESIDGFKCLENECLLIPFRSEELDMLKVFGGLVEKGYFPFGTFEPMYYHISAEPCEDEIIEDFLADLKDVAVGVANGTITSEAMARYM